MIIEQIPIEVYIAKKFEDKAILSIVENWRVETEEVQEIIIIHFKEIGMYVVEPSFEKEMSGVIEGFLKTSPLILKLVRKAERRAALLKGRQHAK